MEKINIKIDTAKLPVGAIFVGQNGHKYIDVDVVARRDGADDYGNTHNVSAWDKINKERVYVGKGKVVTVGEGSQSGTALADDDLPL